MRKIVEFVAVRECRVFTGGALYISLVEPK
jgi:hypothetical protein